MQASSKRTGQLRLALMLIFGVVAAAACVVTLMLWKAPVASAQEEGPTGANFVVQCGFSHQKQVDPIVDFGKPTSFHMHDFFGNTTTDENSTLESLRAAASRPDHGTTCEPKPGLPPNEPLETQQPTGSLLSPGPTAVARLHNSRLAKHSSTTGRV